ncbi:MAG TPA: gamma-glutamylcyclotransferase [Salinisphaeraceae bacterium]|nr:gamma-glutamylcyclotransferase [Salinisphaeraceae bacterium]
MSADTRAANRRMNVFADHASVWLFGYGSLIFKAGFDYIERRPAYIRGWVRRFWQGSHDHRGTLAAPGRVLTLVRQPGACCQGMAYRVEPRVFEQLDVREKNGYLRLQTTLVFADDSTAEGLVYIATADNAAWLGVASEAVIAAQIAASAGPSGPNSEYLLRLADALRALDYEDAHVFAIERQLRALEAHG